MVFAVSTAILGPLAPVTTIRSPTTAAVAAALGIDHVEAEVLPGDKRDTIARLTADRARMAA